MLPDGYVYDVNMQAVEAIPQYGVVVFGSTAGWCKKPTAAKAGSIVGVAQEAATASGDVIRVRRIGRSYVNAGASGSIGQSLAVHDTQGRVSRPTAFVSGDGFVGYYEEAPGASGDQPIAFINPSDCVR